MNTARSATPATRPLSLAAGTISPGEQAVLAAIRALPYGSVEVVVHQSKIVQVVKTEKVRFEQD